MIKKIGICLGTVLAFVGIFSFFLSHSIERNITKVEANPNKDVTRNGEDEGVILFKFPGR